MIDLKFSVWQLFSVNLKYNFGGFNWFFIGCQGFVWVVSNLMWIFMFNVFKIKVSGLVVEFDGDEMICVIWKFIKDMFIFFYFDICLDYYDLGIEYCDVIDDQVMIDVVYVIKKYGVGVKCVMIIFDEVCVEEFNLKKMWLLFNGIIWNILGGIIFCEFIVIFNVL